MESGDVCRDCGIGVMRVENSNVLGRWRTQYLKCKICNATGKTSFAVDRQGRRVFDSNHAQLMEKIEEQAAIIERQSIVIEQLTGRRDLFPSCLPDVVVTSIEGSMANGTMAATTNQNHSL